VNLEQELRDALKRQQPPPGITERVLKAINAREATTAPSFWRRHRAQFQIAAAAVLVVAVGVGVVRRSEAIRERERGESAARQLVTALRIASEALNDARSEIRN
jgi:hypothetical protein